MEDPGYPGCHHRRGREPDLSGHPLLLLHRYAGFGRIGYRFPTLLCGDLGNWGGVVLLLEETQ